MKGNQVRASAEGTGLRQMDLVRPDLDLSTEYMAFIEMCTSLRVPEHPASLHSRSFRCRSPYKMQPYLDRAVFQYPVTRSPLCLRHIVPHTAHIRSSPFNESTSMRSSRNYTMRWARMGCHIGRL